MAADSVAGDFPNLVNSEFLIDRFFSQFGEIMDAAVIMERDDPSRSRGFGFVTYSSLDLANEAITKVPQDPCIHLVQPAIHSPQQMSDTSLLVMRRPTASSSWAAA
jgi:RNA recognition motif-containing protein